eukprot:COSAG05_NODE_2648_length_2806_cov_2.556335_4_plen_254_part_00
MVAGETSAPPVVEDYNNHERIDLCFYLSNLVHSSGGYRELMKKALEALKIDEKKQGRAERPSFLKLRLDLPTNSITLLLLLDSRYDFSIHDGHMEYQLRSLNDTMEQILPQRFSHVEACLHIWALLEYLHLDEQKKFTVRGCINYCETNRLPPQPELEQLKRFAPNTIKSAAKERIDDLIDMLHPSDPYDNTGHKNLLRRELGLPGKTYNAVRTAVNCVVLNRLCAYIVISCMTRPSSSGILLCMLLTKQNIS